MKAVMMGRSSLPDSSVVQRALRTPCLVPVALRGREEHSVWGLPLATSAVARAPLPRVAWLHVAASLSQLR